MPELKTSVIYRGDATNMMANYLPDESVDLIDDVADAQPVRPLPARREDRDGRSGADVRHVEGLRHVGAGRDVQVAVRDDLDLHVALEGLPEVREPSHDGLLHVAAWVGLEVVLEEVGVVLGLHSGEGLRGHALPFAEQPEVPQATVGGLPRVVVVVPSLHVGIAEQSLVSRVSWHVRTWVRS